MRILLVVLVLMASPVLAQETVMLNVNQTHTLAWNWEQTEGPVRSFVFRCGQYMKEIADADARSLRFGSLVDEPGSYTGCTLSARNEAGLSAPVAIPAFDYAYSYKALGLFVLEMFAMVSAAGVAVAASGQSMLGWMRRRTTQAAPLALPEPVIILEKEREHVYRYR